MFFLELGENKRYGRYSSNVYTRTLDVRRTSKSVGETWSSDVRFYDFNVYNMYIVWRTFKEYSAIGEQRKCGVDLMNRKTGEQKYKIKRFLSRRPNRRKRRVWGNTPPLRFGRRHPCALCVRVRNLIGIELFRYRDERSDITDGLGVDLTRSSSTRSHHILRTYTNKYVWDLN